MEESLKYESNCPSEEIAFDEVNDIDERPDYQDASQIELL